MGYDISKLNAFTQESAKPFALKSVLEAQTIKVLLDAGSFDPEAKGNTYINLMDTDVIIQSAEGCGFNAQGGAVLSQAVLSVVPMKINQEYCESDLVKTFRVGQLQKGLEYNELSLATEIAESNSGQVSEKLEELIWKGDVTATGATNHLSKMDGFLKKIKAGDYIEPDLTGATTMVEKLQAIFKAVPAKVSSKPDFRIFVGQGTWDAYSMELSKLNLFKPVTDQTLFGTSVKIEITNGIEGHVVATRLRSLQAGGEMSAVEMDVWYSRDQDVLKLKSLFSLGVTPVYVEEIAYTTI